MLIDLRYGQIIFDGEVVVPLLLSDLRKFFSLHAVKFEEKTVTSELTNFCFDMTINLHDF